MKTTLPQLSSFSLVLAESKSQLAAKIIKLNSHGQLRLAAVSGYLGSIRKLCKSQRDEAEQLEELRRKTRKYFVYKRQSSLTDTKLSQIHNFYKIYFYFNSVFPKLTATIPYHIWITVSYIFHFKKMAVFPYKSGLEEESPNPVFGFNDQNWKLNLMDYTVQEQVLNDKASFFLLHVSAA